MDNVNITQRQFDIMIAALRFYASHLDGSPITPVFVEDIATNVGAWENPTATDVDRIADVLTGNTQEEDY